MANYIAYEILERNIKDDKIKDLIISHTSKVKEIALKIGKKINLNKKSNKKIDLETLANAALLHDIGRERCPPKTNKSILHILEGKKILDKEIEKRVIYYKNKTISKNQRNKTLKEIKILKICSNVARNHLGAGLSKKDIINNKLPLPIDNYVPKNIYEKIVTYADKLANGNKDEKITYSIKRFSNWLGPEYGKRIIKLHNKIQILQNNNKNIISIKNNQYE